MTQVFPVLGDNGLNYSEYHGDGNDVDDDEPDNSLPPVHADGQQGEDWAGDAEVWDKVV